MGLSFPRIRGPLRDGLVVLAASLVLGALGPFGTFADLNVPVRYAYWIGLTLLLWLQCWAAFLLIPRLNPAWLRAIAAALLGSLPATFEVGWVESLLRIEGRAPSPVSMAWTYGCVALIALAVCAPLLWFGVRRAATPPTVAAFRRRLPAHLGGDLVALQSEGHYLRVYTTRGTAQIHCALSTAVEELGEAGAQVHRCWWVARGAATSSHRTKGATSLMVAGEHLVPVGRTFERSARDAGVFPPVERRS